MNISQSRDFPDWIGPMLVKELRQGLKARAFEITFTVLQVILVLVVSYHALLYAKHGSGFNPAGLNSTFWMIVSLQLLLIAPLRALNGLFSERKANTLELIFMSGLSSWRIAWGKWASLFFQSLLFVLAVLPYAVLRYFFGGVNLVEDLVSLGWMLLSSAVLTAAALAVSGLPLIARIAGIGALLFGGSILRAAAFGFFFSPFGTGASGITAAVWLLVILDVVLIGLAALEFAAASIAPVAENHALRQRLIVLCAWLPLPVMHLLNVSKYVMVPQWGFFTGAALALSWIHLSAAPPGMRIHLDTFSRRGPAGFAAATLFQPGTPSATLFLCFVLVLVTVSVRWAFKDDPQALLYCTPAILAGAALIAPPLIWRLFRLRPRVPLVHHTLFLIACGMLVLLVKALADVPRLVNFPMTALLPPFGFFSMLDSMNDRLWKDWFSISVPVFAAYAFVLSLLYLGYWRGMLRHYRDIRKPAESPRVIAEVAA